MHDAETPLAILERVFGYRSFRSVQDQVITDLIRGNDVFVLMPTGSGKSLCFQIPAMIRRGVGVVVSPLISLMKDQVDALRANGVAAACLNSSLTPDQARATLAALHAGQLDLLYVAPERLMQPSFLERLISVDIALIAIDEAHCVSQWGHDFRPEYVELGRLRTICPAVPIIAVTATADAQTRQDTIQRLGMGEARCYVTGFDRPNISYTVLEKNRPFDQLTRFLARHGGKAGIVYALSRRRVEDLADRLVARGIPAAPYHAGMDAARRLQVQDAFRSGQCSVVVATVAFGMGIDKPDVRFVVHFDLPKHIEGYYQETGRAGRDGLPAEALLLFGLQDVVLARSLIVQSDNVAQRRIELHKLNAMVDYAEALTCRRRILLGYFGDHVPHDCGNCDICLVPPERFDATDAARKALSCVYRVGQRFGVKHVIDVLRGARNARVARLGHDRLSTYGIGADRSELAWGSILRQLIHRGYLHQDISNYGVLKLTEQSRPLLTGQTTLELAQPRVDGSFRNRHDNVARALSGPYDETLFERLRKLRTRIARAQGVPSYAVFADATLMQIAQLKPLSAASLLTVNGIGAHKLARYGEQILDTVRDHGNSAQTATS